MKNYHTIKIGALLSKRITSVAFFFSQTLCGNEFLSPSVKILKYTDRVVGFSSDSRAYNKTRKFVICNIFHCSVNKLTFLLFR